MTDQSNEVQIFKLLSGEEVICRVVTENADSYEVKDGRTVAINPQNGGVGLMQLSVMAGQQQKGTIYKSGIVANMFCPKETEEQYLQEVIGITIAKA